MDSHRSSLPLRVVEAYEALRHHLVAHRLVEAHRVRREKVYLGPSCVRLHRQVHMYQPRRMSDCWHMTEHCNITHLVMYHLHEVKATTTQALWPPQAASDPGMPVELDLYGLH